MLLSNFKKKLKAQKMRCFSSSSLTISNSVLGLTNNQQAANMGNDRNAKTYFYIIRDVMIITRSAIIAAQIRYSGR